MALIPVTQLLAREEQYRRLLYVARSCICTIHTPRVSVRDCTNVEHSQVFTDLWSRPTGRARTPRDVSSQAFPVFNVFRPHTIKTRGRPGTEASIIHVLSLYFYIASFDSHRHVFVSPYGFTNSQATMCVCVIM